MNQIEILYQKRDSLYRQADQCWKRTQEYAASENLKLVRVEVDIQERIYAKIITVEALIKDVFNLITESMNVKTGKIITRDELFAESAELRKDYLSVKEADMTPKQKAEKQVRISDHRSKLGKYRIQEEKKQRIQRNDPCYCGSEQKHKRCCGKAKN